MNSQVNPTSLSIHITASKDRLDIVVETGFKTLVEDKLCLWINKGFTIDEFYTQANYSLLEEDTKDPDLGIIDLRRLLIKLKDNGIWGYRIKYHGNIQPLTSPYWRSYNGVHIARAETLWYPFTVSCSSILDELIRSFYEWAIIEFKPRDELSIVTSLYTHEDNNVYLRENVEQAVEFLIAPFSKDSYNTVNAYSLDNLVYNAKQLSEILDEVKQLFNKVYRVTPPYREYNVVLINEGGGYKSGNLIVLDKRYTSNLNDLKACLIHELSHTWWGGYLKLCSRDSYWLLEAIPQYITARLLHELGISDIDERRTKLAKKVEELLKNPDYKPPTKILIPFNEFYEKIWHIMGEYVFHEIANTIGGYSELDKILASIMNAPMKELRPYCITWKKLLEEINRKADVTNVLAKYELI